MGDYKSPVNILRRGDIPSLFTPDFWRLFEIWKFFHFGFGLPGGISWADLEEDYAHALLSMEMHYQNNLSIEAVGLKYQEVHVKMMQQVHAPKKRGR